MKPRKLTASEIEEFKASLSDSYNQIAFLHEYISVSVHDGYEALHQILSIAVLSLNSDDIKLIQIIILNQELFSYHSTEMHLSLYKIRRITDTYLEFRKKKIETVPTFKPQKKTKIVLGNKEYKVASGAEDNGVSVHKLTKYDDGTSDIELIGWGCSFWEAVKEALEQEEQLYELAKFDDVVDRFSNKDGSLNEPAFFNYFFNSYYTYVDWSKVPEDDSKEILERLESILLENWEATND